MSNPLTHRSPERSTADVVLKALGFLFALWIAARIIGWLISPGVVLLAIALWLIVRSQRKRAAKPQALAWVPSQTGIVQPGPFAPTAYASTPYASAPYPTTQTWTPTPAAPVFFTPVSAPMPPRGYWAPTQPGAVMTAPSPVVDLSSTPSRTTAPSSYTDIRTPAEREIEDFVERSWPNV
jgi:hypothetical protein